MVLMGGTLTSSAGPVVVTRVLPLLGCGKRGRATEPAVGTLLGPEGAGKCPLGTGAAPLGHGHCADTVRTGRSSDGVETAHATDRATGTARTLRTAQWTRASLWPS